MSSNQAASGAGPLDEHPWGFILGNQPQQAFAEPGQRHEDLMSLLSGQLNPVQGNQQAGTTSSKGGGV